MDARCVNILSRSLSRSVITTVENVLGSNLEYDSFDDMAFVDEPCHSTASASCNELKVELCLVAMFPAKAGQVRHNGECCVRPPAASAGTLRLSPQGSRGPAGRRGVPGESSAQDRNPDSSAARRDWTRSPLH